MKSVLSVVQGGIVITVGVALLAGAYLFFGKQETKRQRRGRLQREQESLLDRSVTQARRQMRVVTNQYRKEGRVLVMSAVGRA